MTGRIPVQLFAIAIIGAATTLALAVEPSSISGTWTWEWKDGQGITHRHVLDIEGDGNSLAGLERFDDLPAVKVEGLKVEGKAVNFSVKRGERHASYSGKFTDADTISGNVNVAVDNQTSEFAWTASRKPVAKN